MPQMMMTMSQITKKLPIEYRPVPLVVGTKQEIDQLRDVSSKFNFCPKTGKLNLLFYVYTYSRWRTGVTFFSHASYSHLRWFLGARLFHQWITTGKLY